MGQKLCGELLEAGVDYFTGTCKEQERVERARDIALGLADVELSSEWLGRPWSASGYEGFHVGSVTYGERHDGCIIRLGSTVAKSHWQRLWDVVDNVTRIDLQCTYRVTEKPRVVVHRHYQELQRAYRSVKRGPKVSRCTDGDGGYTAYTGRRVSNVFGRIYNKEAQSNLAAYRGCVRYEVQFNGKRSLKVSSGMRRLKLTSTQITCEVLGFFRDRGVACGSLIESLGGVTRALDTSLPRRSTDVSRKLAWLGSCVAPSVRELMNRGDHRQVLECLGLLEFADSVDQVVHKPSTTVLTKD